MSVGFKEKTIICKKAKVYFLRQRGAYSKGKNNWCLKRKFINILEILFDDTDIVISDGEGVCVDTRAPSSGSQFGRRVDVLVSVGEQDNAISLASFEAKREDAAISTQIYQQAKNHRTNAGILNRFNCLLHSNTSDVVYIDLVGPSGYLVQIRRHDEYFICQSLGDFHIPTELIELDFLEGFLTTIYAWKAWIVERSAQLKKAQKKTVVTPNERVSEHMNPTNIHHSP
ncbi:hypothetical protein RO3G_15112 [Rhizopus delemar RA 99-880]|uniref:Fungal-type protein kinase domain-containing protein n=1 Tax=Rhizopus delemar (strain RA 99-880 / ATCC MYA-4621 / FGSC 9543 / NRRL 43880) TaxID=246409 RepID=I1CPM1_RHIO9|nr:hypothetical protein RO3G_15112 [Rhizopus delemar RA 99-880]|eukprot:EIE90401.1 hypothetical protein RO3G_15112 [Rhizopus delemar RA 99-880]